MIPEEVQGPHARLSLPPCRPRVLLGISLEGFELDSADAEEADCKPTRSAHFHINPTNSLIFCFNMVFYIHWNKHIHSFKNKDWNRCCLWKKWLRDGGKVTGLGSVWGGCSPSSDHLGHLPTLLYSVSGWPHGRRSRPAGCVTEGWDRPVGGRLCLHIPQQGCHSES